MKLSLKIKIYILKQIEEKSRFKDSLTIEGIELSRKNELLSKIDALLQDDTYFVYTEGTTKYNDCLEVICRNRVIDCINNNTTIYSIDKLDMIYVWEVAAHREYEAAIEVELTGDFVSAVESIKKMASSWPK